MPRMTTREKLRARRRARKNASFLAGAMWRPIDIHRMRMLGSEPLCFNMVVNSTAFRALMRGTAQYGTPPEGWNGEPLMADGTYADPEKYGVFTIDAATKKPDA